jgi:signal transduction histidine kinase
MRERVHLIGGDFSLESNSGRGTDIRVTVPAGSARDGN